MITLTDVLAMSSGELIETLWNVNQRTKIHNSINKYELIETLWNVNTPADILECASKLN